jgi:ABC-type lipoprotein release transport system permease subunit
MVSNEPYGAEGSMVIGKGVARTLNAEKGDIVPFRAYDGSIVTLQVGDILSAQSELVSSDLVLLTENDFRQITGVPKGAFTDIAVTARNSKELTIIAEKIRRLSPIHGQSLRMIF